MPTCFLVFSVQHLRGDVAFSDVYELKEEVGQTTTSVCRRCLQRVTAVEYSVKVVHAKPPPFDLVYNIYNYREWKRKIIHSLTSSTFTSHRITWRRCWCVGISSVYFPFVADYRESEERPIRRDWDSFKIRTAPEHHHPEGCKCNTQPVCCGSPAAPPLDVYNIFLLSLLSRCCRCMILLFFSALGVWRRPVCLPGSGVTERRRAAGQSPDAAKFYRERCVRHHLHSE